LLRAISILTIGATSQVRAEENPFVGRTLRVTDSATEKRCKESSCSVIFTHGPQSGTIYFSKLGEVFDYSQEKQGLRSRFGVPYDLKKYHWGGWVQVWIKGKRTVTIRTTLPGTTYVKETTYTSSGKSCTVSTNSRQPGSGFTFVNSHELFSCELTPGNAEATTE
jgi:hypothetical protein